MLHWGLMEMDLTPGVRYHHAANGPIKLAEEEEEEEDEDEEDEEDEDATKAAIDQELRTMVAASGMRCQLN